MMVNLGLALFNLIPAFPMDGGRILRAALSGWLGRLRATEIAAGVGQVLAILFGVVSLFQGDFFRVAMAAFIYFAASTELAQIGFEERRRATANAPERDIWTAPAGYHWVRNGNDTWRLVPIVVPTKDSGTIRWL